MTQASGYRQGDYYEAIERLFHDGSVAGLSESQLLERFAMRRDGAAFAALVERHGPMVLGVCRRFLSDPNDVDDAFQAVFLVLVRKASGLRRKELLGNWLYGVACRVAVRARSLAAKREARAASSGDAERLAVDRRRPPGEEPWEAVLRDEGRTWLHEEVERLPRRFRAPVVACYFDGRTHEEAAALLGCPLGTVKGRLALARDMLRKRLERRGLAVPAVALASRLASPDLCAVVPAPLARTTVHAGLALASAASLTTTAAISTSVRTLTEGVLHAMVVSHLKAVAIPSFLVAAGLLAAGARVAARQDGDGKPQPEQAVAVRPEPRAEAPREKADESVSQPEAETVSDAVFLHRIRTRSSLYLTSRDQFQSDLNGSHSDSDKQKAVQRQIARIEALIRSTAGDSPASQAGREFKEAFLDFLRNERTKASVKGPNKGFGMGDFAGFDAMNATFSNMMEAIYNELSVLSSPEERSLVLDLRREGLNTSIDMLNLHEPQVEKLLRAYMDFRWSMQAEPYRSGADGGKAKVRAGEARQTNAGGEPADSNAKAEPPKSPAPAAEAKPAQAANASQGGGFGGGGGMSGPTPEETRQKIAELSALISKYDENPGNEAVLEALNQPITLRSTDKTTLGDLLKQIKQSVTVGEGKKIPVYVDPKGIEEADASLSSPVSIDLEDVPLKFSLRLMLKQLDLAYCVRDGVLIISSIEGVEQELKEAESELMGLHPENVIIDPHGRWFGGRGRGRGFQ